MKKKITTIRDLQLAEKELSSAPIGILTITSQENFLQFATNFVYQNKNIFVFIDDKELLKTIKFDAVSRFTVIINKGIKSYSDKTINPIYRIFSITINGNMREVEEKKLINDIKQSYIQKYSGQLILANDEHGISGKLVFVDSEEILAFDEVGY